ncbi:Toll/interleukin-1 receptor-like protein [Tanacetum coccineum]
MGNCSAFRHTSGNQDSAMYDVNSGTTASLRANGTSYDVFLSFRGEDTRHSFTDHLYKELVRVGIRTFRDNDEIGRGQELKPEIEKAIQSSEASVIVLSENYATSTWCLDELLMILEQMKECNHFVIPVFYHVDPSDVRKQNKTFDIKVKRSSRWTHDNVVRWKAALTKVANLTGFVLAGYAFLSVRIFL